MKYNFFGNFYILSYSIINELKNNGLKSSKRHFIPSLIIFLIGYEILSYIYHYCSHLNECKANFKYLHGIHHRWTSFNGLTSLSETFHDYLIYYIIGPLISYQKILIKFILKIVFK